MKQKILISTGGSGGHVVPATILYEHLKDKYDVSVTTDYRGKKFLDENKYNLEILNVTQPSKNIFLLPLQFLLIIYLTIKSLFFLRKRKINILISTGGYMSIPFCLASRILNITGAITNEKKSIAPRLIAIKFCIKFSIILMTTYIIFF